MNELEIAVAPMYRLCKKARAERVSEAAAKKLAKALEDIGVKIAKEALDYVCMLEEKPSKLKIFKLQLEKSQENCSSTITRGK
jgi:hypothetical protein